MLWTSRYREVKLSSSIRSSSYGTNHCLSTSTASSSVFVFKDRDDDMVLGLGLENEVGHFPAKNYPPDFKPTRLVGKSMQILGKLPNLDVLKFAFNAVGGEDLDAGGDGFRHLKCLKLEEIEIRRWNL
ncbi:hypothetical protein NE237_008722 [Protea cynaroides]|uniref:Uncharacterized protein n=1 Tax=Protea cynaroides TaxID=273540 RepID=A0A9Q0KWF2_9MAGN|nr:hypothetical protein NE237_008722 [Protea cynaroides]